MNQILNFGSLNMDDVYSVDHFVQPGETLGTLGYRLVPGGKGLNQSVALAMSGAQVRHAGKVGKDGLFLLEFLMEHGVDTTLVSSQGSVTGHAIIQVDAKGQNCILLHQGANGEITPEEIGAALACYGEGDLLVLQNEINSIGEIIDRAYEKGMKIALNPSPIDKKLADSYPLEKIHWFLLNEVEGNALTGKSDPEQIADTLLERYPDSKVVLTLGKAGVLYRDRDSRFTHGIYQVDVVDTTAAGDTFTGYFLGCTLRGLPVPECLRLASVASSLAVSRMGAAVSIPAMAEVETSKLSQ